jgi:hypothetical protein
MRSAGTAQVAENSRRLAVVHCMEHRNEQVQTKLQNWRTAKLGTAKLDTHP